MKPTAALHVVLLAGIPAAALAGVVLLASPGPLAPSGPSAGPAPVPAAAAEEHATGTEDEAAPTWDPEGGDDEGPLAARDPFFRKRFVETLRERGPAGQGDWPRLLELLGDETRIQFPAPARRPLPDRICWLVADALITLEARSLVPALTQAVRGEDPQARVAAGFVLLTLGEGDAEGARLLVEALGLPDETEGTGWVEETALRLAAQVMGGAQGTAALAESVAGRLKGLRSPAAGRALLGLGEVGRAKARTVLAGGGTAYERWGILEALAEEPGRAAGLEEVLERVATSDENAWNRRLAARALEGGAPGGSEDAATPAEPAGGRTAR